MTAISVTIEGKPALATSRVAWALTQGVLPYIGRFDMAAADVEALRQRSSPLTIEIDDGGEDPVRIERLYVIGDAAGPNPNVESLLVADRRYWWGYAHVLRRFNMRRHIGHKRVKADEQLELQGVDGNVWYAPYSLPGGNADAAPWTARQALVNVIEEVLDAEPEDRGGRSGWELLDIPGLDSLPFESVEVDDNGADALRRLLDYLPGVGVTLKADGTVVFYSRVNGRESRPLDENWPEYKNFGHLKRVMKAQIRPREIHVLFNREFEIRADFEDRAGSGPTFEARGIDDIWADNVMPSPDYEIDLGAGPVPRGTWVSFQDVISKWNAPGGLPGDVEITSLMIRQAMIPYQGFWSLFGEQGKQDPDDDWGSRIAAMQAHWRTTFRLNRRLVDRTFAIYASRLATINPETGTRAPAVCYSDYCVIPGPRMNFQAHDGETFYAMNFRGYPEEGRLDLTAKPAPAIVSVLDKDQGIVHVNWKIDPLRTFEGILPGFVEGWNGPGNVGEKPKDAGPMADLADRTRNITFNSVTKGGLANITRMSAGYKCIILLTAVPASPNNDAQLQRVKVLPTDVRDMVPDEMEAGLIDARGPIMEVRIGAGVETARVRWLDSRKDDIYRALGIDNDWDNGIKAEIDDLIINLDTGGENAGNAASLTAIARAAAAQIYASFADRAEGSAGYALRRGYFPEGRIDSVTFSVTSEGVPNTVVSIPEDFPPIDFRSLLPASDRKLIAKLAQPGKER